MKKPKIHYKVIDGVKVMATPGRFPTFQLPAAMDGAKKDLWKELNKLAIREFILSVDPSILTLHHTKKSKKIKVRNRPISDYLT